MGSLTEALNVAATEALNASGQRATSHPSPRAEPDPMADADARALPPLVFSERAAPGTKPGRGEEGAQGRQQKRPHIGAG